MSAYISKKLPSRFDVYFATCSAYASWIKSIHFVFSRECGPGGQHLSTLLYETLQYADEVPTHIRHEVSTELNELEQKILSMAEWDYETAQTDSPLHSSHMCMHPKAFFRTLLIQQDNAAYLSPKMSSDSGDLSVLDLPPLYVAINRPPNDPPPARTLSLLLEQYHHNPNERCSTKSDRISC